jgi:hypothetical protein
MPLTTSIAPLALFVQTEGLRRSLRMTSIDRRAFHALPLECTGVSGPVMGGSDPGSCVTAPNLALSRILRYGPHESFGLNIMTSAIVVRLTTGSMVSPSPTGRRPPAVGTLLQSEKTPQAASRWCRPLTKGGLASFPVETGLVLCCEGLACGGPSSSRQSCLTLRDMCRQAARRERRFTRSFEFRFPHGAGGDSC